MICFYLFSVFSETMLSRPFPIEAALPLIWKQDPCRATAGAAVFVVAAVSIREGGTLEALIMMAEPLFCMADLVIGVDVVALWLM